MIKTKYPLDPDIIKPLMGHGDCQNCAYLRYFDGIKTYCAVFFGDTITKTIINHCVNFNKDSLDIINKHIAINGLECLPIKCRYAGLYNNTCLLFNTTINENHRCDECIKFTKGAFL